MMRRLWRLLSDRGGQHAEAGVLMAGLIVVGGAVAVGSMPHMSTAVADQWVCNVSDPGSSRCGGATTTGEVPAGRGFTVKTFGATGSATATAAGYVDPALSHGPRIGLLGNGPVIDVVGAPRPVAARSCVRDSNCIDELGTYYECRAQVSFDPLLASVPPLCSTTITDATPLICTDEGLSATTDTCKGPGGIFHCTNPDASGNRTCTEADNDADAHIPGGIPVSCGEPFDEQGSATCMGSNGTLYQCPGITEDNNGQCLEGGRNIEPLSLTDCVTIATHSSGSTVDGSGPDRATFENGTKERVVRCTYTPSICNPPPADGSACSDQAVSVRCLVDSPSEQHPEYQHCQSLGQVVPDGQSLQTVCVDGDSDANTCQAAVSVATTTGGVPAGQEAVPLGSVDVTIDPAETFDVVLDGAPATLTIDELTDYCSTNVSACDDAIDSQVDQSLGAFTSTMRDLGVCSEDCDAFVDRLAGIGEPSRGRGLLSDGRDFSLGLVGNGLFLTGSIYNLAVGNYVTGTLFTAGTVAAILRDVRNYRLSNVSSPQQRASALALVARATQGLVDGLATVTNTVGTLLAGAETQAERQDIILRYMEEGRGAGGA